MKLVNPANKRKNTIIVVGSGLAGGAAAATMSELGYNVKCFCFQDSPRRAHSIAAQGGINAAKNYQTDSTGITLATKQTEWANRVASEAGVAAGRMLPQVLPSRWSVFA